ncbi:MAG: NAD-dependent epimerase/dehydratase family protein [Planctomycetes bacterium]|nr:NAD-dependent epimerase/dehydratase family protein [Planctomycetota bacterium]
MRSLVTGGAGFIGSHLVERLLAEGDEVVVLDDLSTGSEANLATVISDPRVELRRACAADERALEAALDGCARVFHLAAGVGVQRLFEQPVATIEANLAPARAVFAAAARSGALVVYASSSEVYGKGVRVPFAEGDELLLGPPTSPRWSYACAKAMGEWLALAQARERGLRVVIARLFNTVGPRQSGRYGMVLPRFARQALLGEAIEIHGDGSQTRCFADVREVVRALVELSATPAAIGEIVNVGTDEEVSIASLAGLVAELASSDTAPQFVEPEQLYGAHFEDLKRRVPRLEKLERMLGWRPRRPLREIAHEVVESLREAVLSGRGVARGSAATSRAVRT